MVMQLLVLARRLAAWSGELDGNCGDGVLLGGGGGKGGWGGDEGGWGGGEGGRGGGGDACSVRLWQKAAAALSVSLAT